MEPFTFRPNVASINLCPRFWTLGEPLGSKQVSALVHEMIHGLVSAAVVPFRLVCQGCFCCCWGFHQGRQCVCLSWACGNCWHCCSVIGVSELA